MVRFTTQFVAAIQTLETGGAVVLGLGLIEVIKALVKWRSRNGANGKVVRLDCSKVAEHQQILTDLGRILRQTDPDGGLLIYSPRGQLRDVANQLKEITGELRENTAHLRTIIDHMQQKEMDR